MLSGLGILLSPAVGALVMSLSTVIVAVNARLLGRKGDEPAEDQQHDAARQPAAAAAE